MTDFTSVDVSADAVALTARVAEWLEQQLAATVGSFRIALSGGSTPKALFALLATPSWAGRIPWPRVQLFWGDERYVPYDSADSNYGEAKRLLVDRLETHPGLVCPMPSGPSPEDAAGAYELALKRAYGAASLEAGTPLFDVVFLGLGEDGHTASLIPGQPVLLEQERWVAVVGQGRPEVRLTLTYPALNSARMVAFLVTGASKAGIVQRMRRGDDVPAAHIAPSGKLLWFLDAAAAAQ